MSCPMQAAMKTPDRAPDIRLGLKSGQREGIPMRYDHMWGPLRARPSNLVGRIIVLGDMTCVIGDADVSHEQLQGALRLHVLSRCENGNRQRMPNLLAPIIGAQRDHCGVTPREPSPTTRGAGL